MEFRRVLFRSVSFFVKDQKISKEELKDLIDLIENDESEERRES